MNNISTILSILASALSIIAAIVSFYFMKKTKEYYLKINANNNITNTGNQKILMHDNTGIVIGNNTGNINER